MFFPVGLAAVNQGYDQGAQNYWKRRELEDSQAAYDALGKTFLSMSAPQGDQPGQLLPPGGAGPPPAGPPPGGPLPGGPPGGPGGPMPLGLPSGPPGGGMPGMPMMRPPGPAAPTAPGGALPPGAGAPGPGGPPAQVAGPMRPGGPSPMAGAPMGPGNPMSPAQPMGGGGGPQVPPQLLQRFGQPPYDWRQLAGVVAQANPGASPAVIARAVTMMAPLMNQDSQQQWRLISAQLREQQLGIQAEGLNERERANREREGQTQQRIDQAGERIKQGDKRIELATQAQNDRVEQAKARAITQGRTADLKEREFLFKQWDSEVRARDRFLRADINARTNLTGDDKKKALKEADDQFRQAMDELKSTKEQMKNMPGGADAPKSGPGTAGPNRVQESFSATGQGKTLDAASEQRTRAYLAEHPDEHDAIIQRLQREGWVVPEGL